MRIIGFSTGALAKGVFRRGLVLCREHSLPAVELSALRAQELPRLIEALPELDLSGFEFVSVHAPSQYESSEEPRIVRLLEKAVERKIPVVIHPDAISDASAWRAFGDLLLIENMDRRKPIGRSVRELEHFFDLLPEAGFCLDLGHARQFDPSMTEAGLLLIHFKDRLRQLHVSEVNSFSRHERLSWLSYYSFQRVAGRIPPDVPVILESVVEESEMEAEVSFALKCLTAVTEPELSAAADPAFRPIPATGD